MDPVSGITAGISLGNLASQIFTNKANYASQERQNVLNRQMTWDMWRAENRYNHPAAQMQRLKAAGLNPALMYQDGSAGMPSATMNSPEQTAPQYRPVQLDPLTAANVELARSQAEKNRAEAQEAGARTPTYDKQMQLWDSHIKEAYGNIDLMDSQKRLNETLGEESAQRVIHWMYENDKTRRTLESFVRRCNAEADSAESRALMDEIRFGQYEQELAAYRYQLNAMARSYLASERLSDAQREEINQKVKLFNDTYEQQVAIVRETRNDLVAGKQMKTAFANQANAQAVKTRKETGYVTWRNITGGVSEIVSSGADVFQVMNPPQGASYPNAPNGYTRYKQNN